MISTEAKGLFEKLNMPYPAIALKYHVCRPQGVPKYSGQPKAFCEFLHDAQVNEGSFYVSAEDDSCNGKVILGMADKPPVAASGQSGPDFEMYRQNAANRRIYQEMPVLVRGTAIMFSLQEYQNVISIRILSYALQTQIRPIYFLKQLLIFPEISGNPNLRRS